MSNTLGYHRFMRSWCVCLVVVLGCTIGCTKPNPAKFCADGTCSDPSFPVCDVTGQLGGEAGTCIAANCTAGEIGECRGNIAITCNATGNNYDAVQCPLGCDPTIGCRLCQPNMTACTNGQLATCDAAGNVVSMEACALGCFQDQPRCRDINPSNGLSIYFDMVVSPPDLDLSQGNAGIDTGSGTVAVSGTPIIVPNFFVAKPTNGVAIRVLVAKRVRLGNVTVFDGNSPDRITGAALAILATETITVEGRITVEGTAGTPEINSCTAARGRTEPRSSNTQCLSSGSGGGGHATSGGTGGGITPLVPGGFGGQPSGNDALVPLRGGCPSGGTDTDLNTAYVWGAPGGGAIQLVSRRAIEVTGTIDANGAPGLDQAGCGAGIWGGGAGGGILLEAPTVTLEANAKLLAKGGGGGSRGTYPTPTDGPDPLLGMMCGGIPACGDGGNGAAVGAAAVAGNPAAYAATGQTTFTAGGGGGGLGRLRINTKDGSYLKANTTVEAASTTVGAVGTR